MFRLTQLGSIAELVMEDINMKKVLLCLIALSFILTACSTIGANAPTEKNITPSSCNVTDVPAPVNTSPEDQQAIFEVSDDSISLVGSEFPTIKGITGDVGNINKNFSNSEVKYGILPPLGSFVLSFQEKKPLKVTWRIYDGLRDDSSSDPNVIDNPTQQFEILLGISNWTNCSSNHSAIPNRRLWIECQYLTKTVHYFLIIASTSCA